MINVSNRFKQALIDDQRHFDIRADITLHDGTKLSVTNEELWSQGFEVESAVSGNSSFDVGGFIIGRMRLVINNIYEDYTQYDFHDANVNVTLSLNYDSGELIGRNLLLDTEDERISAAASNRSAYTSYYNASAFGKKYFHEEGCDLTISADYEVVGEVSGNAHVYCQLNGTPIVPVEDQRVQQYVADEPIGTYIRTFRLTSDQASRTVSRLRFHLYGTGVSDGAKVKIRNVKLEIGRTATDWEPAPEDNGTVESIVFDNFTVDETNDNASQIILSCLDNAKRFERPYSESNLIYPASVDTIVRDACDTCGVPLLTTAIPNGNYIVPSRPDNSGLTFLKVISWCAQLTGNFARINNHGQLVVGWYDKSTFDETTLTGGTQNGTEWTIEDDTADSYHHIVSWGSLVTGTDDVTVTGVKVVATDADNAEFTGFSGNDGYVLEVRDNDLIGVSDVQTIADKIASNVVGLNFRTYSGACLGDPTIESGDLAWITDRKGRSYRSFVSGTSFKLGQYQTIYCGAATPSKKASTSYNESTRAIVKTREAIRKSLTDYNSRVSSMAELIARGFGMYFTSVTQPDGSTIPYIHDKPTLAESSFISYMTSEGIMMESDGQTTSAVDKNGNALVNTLTARGINADWINSGAISIRDTNGNETFYANCLTGEVRINASSFSLTGSTIQQITQTAVDNVKVGARNLLLNSSFSEGFDKWGKNARCDFVTEDGYPCGHISGGTGTYTIKQAILERIKDDEADQIYTASGDIKLVNYADNTDTTIPHLSFYLTGYYLDESGNSKWTGATRVGGTVGKSSHRQFVPFSDQGWVRVNYVFKFAKKPSEMTDMAFDIYTRNWSGDLYFKNLKLERGNRATDWTPAPEDLQTGISNAVNTANSANATANSANTTAQQALNVASSAGGLIAYLDNDYQTVPTNADGTYTTFPECTSQITVFYNSSDVSSQCTYSVAKTDGVTGTWDSTTRTYTVTGLSVDSGTVTISAAYNNISLSKKFTIAKVKQGISGTDGRDGADGDNGRGISSMEEYYAISDSNKTAPTSWSTSVVLPTADKPYLWNYNRVIYNDNTQEDSDARVIGNYSKDGKDGTKGADGEDGRGIKSITEHYGLSNSIDVEPATWSDTMLTTTTSNKFLWNYETIAYTDNTSDDTSKRIIGTHGATGTAAYNYSLLLSDYAIVKDANGTLTPSSITMTGKRVQGTKTPANYAGRFKVEVSTDGETYSVAYTSSANEATHSYTPTDGVKNIRVSLYLAGGTTTLLDSQTVPIVSDGENGADGFSPLISADKVDGVTTVVITDKNGSRSITINDGSNGASIKTVTNYYLASASASGVTTSTSGWTTNPTATAAKITASKPYLWNYEVSKDSNGNTIATTNPAIIGHYGADGANGTNGTNGRSIKTVVNYYLASASSSGVTTSTSGWQSNPTNAVISSAKPYLWNYEVLKDEDGATVTTTNPAIIGHFGKDGTNGTNGKDGINGVDGKGIVSIEEYYALSSTTTAPATSKFSTAVKTPTVSNRYLWNYEVITYTDESATTTDRHIIGVYGASGTNGRGITSIVEHYALSETEIVPADSEFGTEVKTPTTALPYLWNYETVTYSDNTTEDTPKHVVGICGRDGVDAYTVILTNESHTFAGGTSAAVASNVTCGIVAYKGGEVVPAKIGTITGQVTGLTTSIQNNDSTSPSVIISVTTAMNTKSGTLAIPVTVDGNTFTKTFSWGLALNGKSAYNYEILSTVNAIIRDKDGNISPNVITFTGRRNAGTSAPANYAGRFVIETTEDGTNWTTDYTSTANEATKTYNPPKTASAVRCTLYLAGGTATQLDTQTIHVIENGQDGVSPTITSSKSGGVTTVTITDVNGSRSLKINDGANGASVKTITNYYLASASASGVTTTTAGWSTNPTSTNATMTKDKPYLWNYEISKDSNGTTIATTSPAIIGRYGVDGNGVSSITEYYAVNASTTAPADSAFSTTVTAPTKSKPYLWNYEKITYTNGTTANTGKHIIGVCGQDGVSPTLVSTKENGVTTVTITDVNGTKKLTINDGAQGASVDSITNYYLASASGSGVTTSTSGWTTNPTATAATMTATKQYLWNYEVTKDASGKVISTTSPCIIGRYGQNGAKGENGKDGKGVSSIAEYYALSTGTTAPADSAFTTSVKTPTATNKYLWNYEKITYTDSTVVSTSKHIIGVYGDTGADSYTVILTNESHSFAGDVSNALASSVGCSVIAYKGTTRIAATIGTITGQVTGLTTTIANNGTTSAKFTASATTNLKTASGVLTVPITVDGKSFTKTFSWNVAFKGAKGETGTTARTYFLDVTPKSVKLGESLEFAPKTITANAFYRDGESTAQTAYSGTILVQACVGDSWSQIKSYSGSSVTLTLNYTEATKVSVSGNTVNLPQTATALRFQLKATSTATTFLDQQEVIILIDASSLTQEIVFNKLTNNGETQGLFLEGGKVYLNAEYIKSKTLNAQLMFGGTLILGGKNNANGLLQVRDADNVTRVTLNNEGITAVAGKIGGWTITSNSIRKEVEGASDNVLIGSTTNNILSVGATWTSGEASADWAGAPFRVTKDGSMYSKKGTIGGWTIDNVKLSNVSKNGKCAMVRVPPGASDNTGYCLAFGGTDKTFKSFKDAVFRVREDGYLVAQSASIEGKFTATDANGQTVMIQEGIIYGKINNTQTGFIDMSAEYASTEGSGRNIVIKGGYGVRLKAGNKVTMDIADTPTITVNRNGLTASSLHASNGFNGWVCLPIQMVSDGTVYEYARVRVVDGVIQA